MINDTLMPTSSVALAEITEETSVELKEILNLLRKQTGYNFSLYKPSSIIRRIEKRLEILQINTLPEYVYYLYQHPFEISILFKTLLIHVTHFFRDIDAFDLLKKELLKRIVKTNTKDFRVWIPGCSTGEEAYSVAIILQECMTALNIQLDVRIFATDIDQRAIETAREGIFLTGIAKHVSAERLQNFFTKKNGAYKVKKSVRSMIVFAVQNIIEDPPFSNLNLLCCRNLLIYLKSPLQNKVLSLFQNSLSSHGLLLLGPSENLGISLDFFNIIDSKWRLFERKFIIQSPSGRLSLKPISKTTDVNIMEKRTNDLEPKLATLVKGLMIKNYTPAFMVVDEGGEIVYIHGRTSKFLELPCGEVRLHFMSMIRPELKSDLHLAMHKASAQQKEVILYKLQITEHNEHQYVNVKISPIKELDAQRELLLIIIEETSISEAVSFENHADAEKLLNEKIFQAADDFNFTKNRLKSIIDELEATNEELKSINEELQATNDELSSFNEILATTNQELENRIEHLASANDEIRSLLENTEIATICLDKDLCIKQFTPKASEIINLIPADVGRPVHHLVSNLHYHELIEDARTVLNTLEPMDTERVNKNGHHYLIKIIPYRSMSNSVDGVVLTFLNIQAQKDAENKLKTLESRVSVAPAPAVVPAKAGIHP